MRVLVACEESQAVTMAFRALGHEAYSCDIQEPSGGHPEWHIQGDALKAIEGGIIATMDGHVHNVGRWDMLIAHPPCTDLAVSGARWFAEKQKDGRQQRSIVFFMQMALANIPRVAVENPVCIMSSAWRKPDQIIHPWQFGHAEEKTTCLWLRGLPPLRETKNVHEYMMTLAPRERNRILWLGSGHACERSKTFPGIARAMAEQWGGKIGGADDMLKWVDLMGEAHDRVQTAIDRLRNFEPPEGYYLAFSGGKDSQAIYHLAKQAGVKFDAHYNVTSVDPPELVRFIKRQYPDVHFDIPHDKNGKPVTMWSLIASQTMPPTRIVRYCCAQLKEMSGNGRLVVTGVRWSESVRRKNERHLIDSGKREGQYTNYDNEQARKMVEQCYLKRRTTLNPIIDWSEEDVWEYLNDVVKVPHCELYDQGFTRLGCIGCPMQQQEGILKEFKRWPKYRENYLRAFAPMLENAKKRGRGKAWETVDDVMRWWIKQENKVKIEENQMEIEEEYDE